ncbi:hypothetical protein FRACYDRAFT_252510, partial [Fragilariopsis cylindrus CCMP1102]
MIRSRILEREGTEQCRRISLFRRRLVRPAVVKVVLVAAILLLPVVAAFTTTTTPSFALARTKMNTDITFNRKRSREPSTIRVERYARLPVWPVWAGVIDFFVGWILGPENGSILEQYVLGGRVCPMQFDGTATSPFILLVHHHHNFWKWDFLFRKLSAFVLPEGFPAHPHRGFTTLTYFLPSSSSENDNNSKSGGGGFIHRDSLGVKQKYGSLGSSNNNNNPRYTDHAQWLFTGSGMLHEEMFDFEEEEKSGGTDEKYNSRYELYQLWINVPSNYKLDPPQVQLLLSAASAISISPGERLIVIPTKLDDPVDLLVLSGCPLYAEQGSDVEPIATQGSMVMNYPSEIDDAY